MLGPVVDSGGPRTSHNRSSNSKCSSRSLLHNLSHSIFESSTKVPRILFVFCIFFALLNFTNAGKWSNKKTMELLFCNKSFQTNIKICFLQFKQLTANCKPQFKPQFGPYSDIFGHIRTYSDIFGHIRTIFGHIRTYSDIFGHIRTIFGHIRTIFEHIRTIFEHMRTIFEHIRTIFGHY